MSLHGSRRATAFGWPPAARARARRAATAEAWRAAALATAVALCACPPPPEEGEPLVGDGFAAVVAIDAHTVLISFRRAVDPGTVSADRFSVNDFTVVPPAPLAVVDASLSGDAEVTVLTATQQRGVLYTLRLEGVADIYGFSLDGSVNFVGAAPAALAPVTFAVTDLERAAAYGALSVQVNVDASGRFSAGFSSHALVAGADALTTTLDIVVDPLRSVDRGDDGDVAIDRRAYTALAVDAAGVPASPLVPFEVRDTAAQTVELPLFDPGRACPDAPFAPLSPPPPPTDPTPGDGVKRVRLIIDDRQPRELEAPAVSVTADASGAFSVDERQVAFEDPDGDRIYELLLDLQVDPARTNTDIESAPLEELPYIAFLVTGGAKRPDFYIFVTAVDEEPANVVFPLGDPEKIPVTLRVDVGAAFLTADGAHRGLLSAEAVFVTGNFSNIVDAFGQNCADTWSGGENLNLRMRQRPGAPGVWEKTLWLPPGRSQTWKVVRCDAALGCGALNAAVTSTGQAFATVMKNLVTENLDASEHSEVQVVDPYHLDSVFVGGQTRDYRGAEVYLGQGIGREDDPPGTPDPGILFKQEIPNLVVSLVGNEGCPLQTPVYVIGSWRDVNLPLTTAEILAAAAAGDPPFDLGPHDYDASMVGAPPPSREEP